MKTPTHPNQPLEINPQDVYLTQEQRKTASIAYFNSMNNAMALLTAQATTKKKPTTADAFAMRDIFLLEFYRFQASLDNQTLGTKTNTIEEALLKVPLFTGYADLRDWYSTLPESLQNDPRLLKSCRKHKDLLDQQMRDYGVGIVQID